jgi:hypothetical protein
MAHQFAVVYHMLIGLKMSESNQNIWQMENLFQPLSTCLKQQIGWKETWDFYGINFGTSAIKKF